MCRDTAGQERFRSLIPSYIRDSSVAVIFLVGNKTDLVDKRKVSTDEGEAKTQEHGAMFIETSAKAGFNIKPLFRKIARYRLGMDALSSVKQEDMVDINLRPSTRSSASGAASLAEHKSDFWCFIEVRGSHSLAH